MPFCGDAPRDKLPVQCNFKVSSELKPESERQQSCQVEIDQIKLTDLPGIMRNMGWSVAPRLMEKWFCGNAYTITRDDRKIYDADSLSIPSERYDDSIVTIAWAQNFERFEDCREFITGNYLTPKSIETLKERLEKAGWPGIAPRLGHASMSARELNAVCQIQTQSFGDSGDDLDDMYGALGTAMVQLAAVGHVRRDVNGDIFVFEKFGVYIKDVYEFNGLQFLGLWTREKTLGKLEAASWLASGVTALHDGSEFIGEPSIVACVLNSDFEKYREKYNKGGDFIIYSDVLWVDVPRPDSQKLVGIRL